MEIDQNLQLVRQNSNFQFIEQLKNWLAVLYTDRNAMYDIDVPYTEDFKALLTAYCIIYVMRYCTKCG